MRLRVKTALLIILLVVVAALPLAGCGQYQTDSKTPDPDTVSSSEDKPSTAEPEPFSSASSSPAIRAAVRVGALKGPSSLGMLELMDKNDKNETANTYGFTIEGAPADVQTKFLNGELDIIAVPTNLASVLYNKTNKDVSVIAVNTLGVLYVLTNGVDISSVKDLEGKTIYATGQGATPEYVLNYIIEQNGLSGKVNVEYKTEHAELATLMAAGQVDLAMLPQPFVTIVMTKNQDIKISLDLNEEWRKASGGSELTMTCIVVSKGFLRDNSEAVANFLEEYKKSTDYVNNNIDEAAALSQKYDIVPEAVAKLAIPKCGIVFIDGGGMKASVEPFLKVLFAANPAAIGGAVPDDAFYYQK